MIAFLVIVGIIVVCCMGVSHTNKNQRKYEEEKEQKAVALLVDVDVANGLDREESVIRQAEIEKSRKLVIAVAEKERRVKRMEVLDQRRVERRVQRQEVMRGVATIREGDDPNLCYCPKCHSTSITVVKKGFGLGKAAVGAVLLGPIGLVGGALGANKIEKV